MYLAKYIKNENDNVLVEGAHIRMTMRMTEVFCYILNKDGDMNIVSGHLEHCEIPRARVEFKRIFKISGWKK